MVTHLTSDNHDLIEKIDGGPEQTGSWLQQHKDQANKKADELLKIEKSVDHRVAKTLHSQWIRKCNAKERGLNKAIDEQKSCDSIELLQPELQDLHKCKANDSTERGFGMMNRKIRGAKEFKDVVQVKEDAKTWKKNLGKMNEGIFLFMQSVRMMATERRQEIHDTACQAFSGTPKDAAMRCLITWWLEISEHLHEIGLLMKSQEKMTRTDSVPSRSTSFSVLRCTAREQRQRTQSFGRRMCHCAALSTFARLLEWAEDLWRRAWRTITAQWVSSKPQCSPL
jgi:hypothetical protein